MTLEEVADLLGVNYQLIYKLVRTGEMPSLRIGRVYRVTKADFEAYIQKNRSHVTGGVCSVCGTAYDSRLSLKHSCLECGGSICVDCWSRNKVRVCPRHEAESAGAVQTVAETIPNQPKSGEPETTEGNQPESGPGENENKNENN
jgi:excisionase family DNA binding protein